nr:hypothetical protein [Tanacetum cinerariifolium]
MTGNKFYLIEYQDFSGGHVAFGEGVSTAVETLNLATLTISTAEITLFLLGVKKMKEVIGSLVVSLDLSRLATTLNRDGEEDVVMGEAVVVTSSSLEMLTKSFLGGMMVSLIFLERLEDEA